MMNTKKTHLIKACLSFLSILIVVIYALSPWGNWSIFILSIIIITSLFAGTHWYRYLKAQDNEEEVSASSYSNMASTKQPIKTTSFYQSNQKKTSFITLVSGIATSILALFLVNFISSSKNGIYLMSYYLDFVLPIGAIGVGFVAGSGYGIASWLKGFKVNLFTLLLILFLQITVYLTAKYIEFDKLDLNFDNNTFTNFWHYYDTQVRSFAWDKDLDGKQGKPLGLLGYAINILEIIGFTLGALTPPLILYLKPYCENCRIYMNTSILCFIPAGLIPKKIKSKDHAGIAAYEMEQKTELEKGNKILEEIKEAIALNDIAKLNKIIEDLIPKKKNAFKLTQKIRIDFVFCKECCNGHIQPILYKGLDEKLKSEKLNILKLPNSLTKILSQNNYSSKKNE